MEPKTMMLPVKLTEQEVALRAQVLCQNEAKLSDAEERLENFIEAAKETKKGIEAEIADAREGVRLYAKIVRNREEYREVVVMEEPDFALGAMQLVRQDTLAIVTVRPMSDAERQRSLFTEAKPDIAKEGA